MKESRFPELKFPMGEKLISDYVKAHAKNMPNHMAISFYGREVTFRELDESSDKLATAIADMGYKKGDRITVYMQSCPQIYITYLASTKLGLIIVPIDPMSRKFELEYILNDVGARLIVVMDQLYPVVKEVKAKCEIKHVIVTSFQDFLPDKPDMPLHPMMKAEKETFEDTYEFLELLERYPPNPPKVGVKLSDNGWILYTGGTTGAPKGCLHTQFAPLRQGVGASQVLYNASKDDAMLVSWPHTHIAGIGSCMCPSFVSGMKVVMLTRWDPIAAMKGIEKYGVTLLNWTTPQYIDVINHPEVKNYDLTSLKLSFVAPFVTLLTEDLYKKWSKLTNSKVYHWGYSASEFFQYSSYGIGVDPFRQPCVALALPAPGVEIKIVDPKTRKEVPAGKDGEIAVKSPNNLIKYWNKPEETEKYIVGGWVYMGDGGRIDEEGILYFTGRIKEIMKVSGYTVAPGEIEWIGMKHPAVHQIAVIGVPDPKKGQAPKAFVTMKPGFKLSASELEGWFKENISAIKRPTVEIMSELPFTKKGDIDRKKLAEEERKKT